MSSEWTSYDEAAATHDRIAVPAWFAAPARDLAARMDFAAARATLDVGTGSGVVALAAASCAFVVGVDPSLEMLRRARANGVAAAAAAALPGLPFPAASFDRVTAGFVLSHVQSYAESLADMVRVLRPGGKLGATAWSRLEDEIRDCWHALVERYSGDRSLGTAVLRQSPHEEWLGDSSNLRAALQGAGLKRVAVEEIDYPARIAVADFLGVREASATARYLRAAIGEPRAREALDAARREFCARFTGPLDAGRRALIAVGER